jgi:AraC-like DNA-binding protein
MTRAIASIQDLAQAAISPTLLRASPPPSLEPSLQAFEALSGCRLCLHDHARLFVDGEGRRMIAAQRGSHRVTHALCGATERELCLENCMHRLNRRVERRHERCFLKRCPRGSIEVVAPIYRGGNHVATLFAGIWSLKRGDAAAEGLPPAQRSELQRLRLILPIFADGLRELCRRQQEPAAQTSSRKREIEELISSRCRGAFGLPELAAQLGLSASRAGHVIKELFGESFVELLARERLLHARHFLVNSDYRMKEIAQLCGLGSAEHFNRLFRRRVGITPGEYRQRHRTTLI